MKSGIKLALIVVSIILLISLAANGYLYNSLSENSNLRKQTEEMRSQINSLESQTQNLQSQIGELQNQSNNTITALNSQIAILGQENDNLQKENENLTSLVQSLQNKTSTQNQSSTEGRMANLVTRLGTKIYNTVPIGGPTSQQVLVIDGEVENNGSATAYNCQIEVVTNELNNPNPFIDYFQIGSGNLTVGSNVNFFANVIHGHIVNWQIFPEWTNTP